MMQTEQQTQQGKRQHPLWILFSIVKSIKEVIIPIIYFFLIQMNSDSFFTKYGSLALIAYMIYRVISILFSWKNFKYVITGKNIEITEGRLKKEKRYIPLDRIQSIQQNTTFFHRMVGLTSLTLLTGATDDSSSVKLAVISLPEASNIKSQLNLSPHVQKDEQEPLKDADENARTESDMKPHYEMTNKEIVKASFTSFYFLAPIPFLLFIYGKLDDIFSIEDFFESAFHSLDLSWFMISLIVLIALILSIIIGVLLTYLQYGNFQISSNDERVYIRKGVFNQTNFSIPKNRINAIKLNKSLMRRWLKMVRVELVSAGSIGEEESHTNVLFPFISEQRAKQLVPEILPAFHFETIMTKLPRSALWTNLLRPSYLWIIATIVVFYFWPTYWYASPALLILVIVSRISAHHRSGYTLTNSFIQLESGTFSTEVFVTTRKKIAELEIKESWLEQRFGLASLSISTRAKPMEVTTISRIPKEMAIRYYHWYANRQS